MSAFDELALEVSNRVACGERGGGEFAHWLVEQPAMKDELRAVGRRLHRDDPSLSREEWTADVTGRFRISIARVALEGIRNFVHYWRRVISSCIIAARNEHLKGTRSAAFDVKVEPAKSEDVDAMVRDGDWADAKSYQTGLSRFELNELENCIYEQIKANFSQKVQTVLILLVLHQLTQAEIGRALGITASAVSQSVNSHRAEFQEFVKTNCLGELV